MSWGTPIIHSVGDVLTAADWNTSSNDLSFLAGTASANILTVETTTSTTYTDLATVGPAVTLTTGANALVIVTASLSNSGSAVSNFNLMGYAVSGASTVAATDNTALSATSNPANSETQMSMATVVGLTAGSNTFTAKYKVGAGTGSFSRRVITVIPLP